LTTVCGTGGDIRFCWQKQTLIFDSFVNNILCSTILIRETPIHLYFYIQIIIDEFFANFWTLQRWFNHLKRAETIFSLKIEHIITEIYEDSLFNSNIHYDYYLFIEL
jgi:hypothetical protein